MAEKRNPILLIQNAGRGTTPQVPDAKYKRGDVVKVRNTKALANFPREAVVAVAIPSGFSPDYALADLVGEAKTPDQDFIDANCIFDDDHEDDLALCCGLDAHGHCSQIGTEWCDWKCPFNGEANHNNTKRRRARSAPLLDILGEALTRGGSNA